MGVGLSAAGQLSIPGCSVSSRVSHARAVITAPWSIRRGACPVLCAGRSSSCILAGASAAIHCCPSSHQKNLVDAVRSRFFLASLHVA